MTKLTANSLFTMSPDEVVRALADYTKSQIPQSLNDESDIAQAEYWLGRLGNDYSYVIELLAFSRNYVRRLKRNGEKELYEDMIDTRDALDSIASAIKLKYQAVSRMLSVQEMQADATGMYPYRKERERND